MAGEAQEIPPLTTKVIGALAEQAIEGEGRISSSPRCPAEAGVEEICVGHKMTFMGDVWNRLDTAPE